MECLHFFTGFCVTGHNSKVGRTNRPIANHALQVAAEIGIPVDVGGMSVHPSDLIVGDRHGVIQVPHDLARKLPEMARRWAKREAIVITAAQQPDVSVESLKAAMARMQQTSVDDIH